jgi:predicted DNA-binding transcriptional regulator YafY
MMTTSRLIAAAALLGAAWVAAPAAAQTMSAHERAVLASVSPALRAEIETRAQQPGQKVSEIIDTILLNKISLAFANGKIVATDYEKGIVVVEGPGGLLRVFRFDVTTLDLKS